MKPRRRAQRGFTLLELLVTLTITTIGLIGLLGLHVSLSRGSTSAGQFAEATQVAASTLESLRSDRIADMATTLTGNPTATPPIDVTMSTVDGRAGMTYRRRVVVSALAASTSLWHVRVEVSWTEDGAAPGADATLDHMIAVEVVRTIEEAL